MPTSGDYIPVLVGPTPGVAPVSVSMANGYTYSQLMSSMKSINYFLTNLFIEADAMDQIEQEYSFIYRDAHGKDVIDVIPFVRDPYQVQFILDISFDKKQYILNGRTAVAFDLLPNQSIQMFLGTINFNPADLLNNVKTGTRGFLFLNDIQEFMDQYKDSIHPITDGGTDEAAD